MENHKYAVVDIETTGHSSTNGDRIIQLAIVFIENNKIVNTYTTFINPEKPIPLFIQDLTNIADRDVQHAPIFEDIGQEVLDKLQDYIFVAHNIHFDLPFLQKELKRVGLPKLVCKTMDTVEFTKLMFPNLYSYKLQDIAGELEIGLESAHRADDDALATAHLLLKCMEQLTKLPLKTIELLHKRSFHLKSNLSILFFEVLVRKRGELSPEKFLTFRGIPVKETAKEILSETELVSFPQTKEMKIELFSKNIPNFEEREGQFELMDQIQAALANKSEIVCEAETGIGKTLGYLLPAVLYSFKMKKPVIISTYTTHLIDQLVGEEIPKINAILETNVKVATLKGMHHYIDLFSFWQQVKLEDESYDETFTIMQILVWLTLTEDGDLTELNVSGGGQLFVDKIRRGSLSNIKEVGENDFYERALRKSNNCHILVTNHAMVMNDQERKQPLLTSGCAMVVDEAHQMIHASMSRGERIFSYTNWKYVLGQFGTLDTEQLLQKLELLQVPLSIQIQLEKQYVETIEKFDRAISYVIDAFLQKSNRNGKSTKKMMALEDLDLEHTIFRSVANSIQVFIFSTKSMIDSYSKHVEEEKLQSFINEWQYWIRELAIKVSEWDEIFLQNRGTEARWLEMDTRSIPGSLTVIKRPLNYQEDIKNALMPHRELGAVIWTSGTITVPSNRNFITSQLGLGSDIPIYQYKAASDYYNGAELLIVENMPDIKQVSQSDYIEAVAEAVVQTVLVSEGRCFVLFTSQDMLRKTVELIQDTNLLDDYMLFAQGMTSGSRMRLLKSFQRFSKSVLFGTNSFWEGVDVPGDALSVIIMVRLPFSSPDDPLFKKRADLITKNGQNPFSSYSLPEAVLRFRQGFGRLIRSSADKGVFIVLDRRIETKSYGRDFLQAIPNIPVKKVSLENMVLELENWYTNEG
ncbi:ATP-dependent DNA helicase DinG [Psychrobacillus sp. NPDC096623]|uniref:ATP-dependent DNA helicase DinG n=1 Tax=Psychrobacillus sp. NPDC096623 TaxID=3364492 RepID=UPI003823A0A5